MVWAVAGGGGAVSEVRAVTTEELARLAVDWWYPGRDVVMFLLAGLFLAALGLVVVAWERFDA